MRKSDKWIPCYFVVFFLAVAIIDGAFVYVAVTTHTGVVTDQPYEKGLAYTQTLKRAQAQAAADIRQKASYAGGMLRWKLADHNGQAIDTAAVKARLIRPVQDGYDFDIELSHTGNGQYEARLEPPLPGAWTAKLDAEWKDQWDTQRYQTTLRLITP